MRRLDPTKSSTGFDGTLRGAERKRALTAFQQGYVSETELDARMRSINERVEAYEAEIQRQESCARDYEQRVAMLDDFVAMAEHVSDRLDDVSAEEETEITHALVSRVTCKFSLP